MCQVISHQGEKAQELSSRRQAAWLGSINRKDWSPGPGACVCSVHFINGKPAPLFEVSNPDWVPTLSMGYDLRIVDCTEVFIEQPSDLLAHAQVWSNYKHHSTVKFLIGITPQGTISFLSRCSGGRISDKVIVEHSNLLNHLIPDDFILADRGFMCNDYAQMVLAEVKTPPFTKGKKQLGKSRLTGAGSYLLFVFTWSV